MKTESTDVSEMLTGRSQSEETPGTINSEERRNNDSSRSKNNAHFKKVFYKRLFLFDGRSSRHEFSKMSLIILAIAALPIAMLVVDGTFTDYGHKDETSLGVIISWLVLIPLAFALLSVLVRRFHDMNMSGWLVLLFLLLFPAYGVNIVAALVFIFMVGFLDGTPGENRFGQDPLGRNEARLMLKPFGTLRAFSAVNSIVGLIVLTLGIVVAAIAYCYGYQEGYSYWSSYEYPYREFFWPIVVATIYLTVTFLLIGAFSHSQIAIADNIEKLVAISIPRKQNIWLLIAGWYNRVLATLIAFVGIYMPTFFKIHDDEHGTFVSLFMVPFFLFLGWLTEGIAEIFFCQAWSEATICGDKGSDSSNDTPKTVHNSSLINQSSVEKVPAESIMDGFADQKAKILSGESSSIVKAEQEGNDATKEIVPTVNYKPLLTLENLAESMVTIPKKGYALCKFATTLSLWNAVMGKDEPTRPDLPIWNVSWNDCENFIDKLNSLPQVKDSGRRYRLPTVDEWEYACRAGASGDYCKLEDGTEISAETLGEVAWFKVNSNGHLHPAGQKRPNAFGLYDMHGNIEEWSATSKSYGKCHCGGSWWSSAEECKVGIGNYHAISYPDENLGLRLACDVVQ